MIEDKRGNIWICTEGGGLNVFDPVKNTFQWYTHRPSVNSISHNNVKAIWYDEAADCMWLGLHLGGINKLDIKTGRFLSIGKWKVTRKVYLPILCVTSFLIKIVWSLPRNREFVCFRVLPANADSCFSRTRRENSFVWWPTWNLIKRRFMDGCNRRRGFLV